MKIDIMTVICTLLLVVDLWVVVSRIANRGNTLNGGPIDPIIIINSFVCLILIILIIYSIVKYFELGIKYVLVNKNQETEKIEECKTKKKKLVHDVVKNVIVVILIFVINELLEII